MEFFRQFSFLIIFNFILLGKSSVDPNHLGSGADLMTMQRNLFLSTSNSNDNINPGQIGSHPINLNQDPFNMTNNSESIDDSFASEFDRNNTDLLGTMQQPQLFSPISLNSINGSELIDNDKTDHQSDDLNSNCSQDQAKTKRTPADFLGEHQNLVDLEKLIEKNSCKLAFLHVFNKFLTLL